MKTTVGAVTRWLGEYRSLGVFPMPPEVAAMLENHYRSQRCRFIALWAAVPAPWVLGLPLSAALYYSGLQTIGSFLVLPMVLLPLLLLGIAALLGKDAGIEMRRARKDLEARVVERFALPTGTFARSRLEADQDPIPTEVMLLPISEITVIVVPGEAPSMGSRVQVFTAGESDSAASDSVVSHQGAPLGPRQLSLTERQEVQRAVRWSPVIVGGVLTLACASAIVRMLVKAATTPTYSLSIIVVILLGLFAFIAAVIAILVNANNRMLKGLLRSGVVHHIDGAEVRNRLGMMHFNEPALAQAKSVEWFPEAKLVWTLDGHPAEWRRAAAAVKPITLS